MPSTAPQAPPPPPEQLTTASFSGSVEVEQGKNPVEPQPTHKAKRKSLRKRSTVWLHFKTFEENGLSKAECKYCNKIYNADPHVNGTSTLHAHAGNCKKNPHNEETRQKLLSFQQSIGGSSGEGSLGNWEYDEGAIRKALSYFIILDEQPFKLVEGVGLILHVYCMSEVSSSVPLDNPKRLLPILY